MPQTNPKPKRHRKRIDPKDGKEISEEYDTIEEEDENNLNKENEIKSDAIPEIESSVNSNSEKGKGNNRKRRH
ncbi:hypothetical protein H477_5741 [[Clostridium] sordellii ATCC 9714]|nr:hypothetical protein H477_5741 [[Clostridium] sordellii ATCC 9714] [Paeniclostridium sordellii ATCC 9714]